MSLPALAEVIGQRNHRCIRMMMIAHTYILSVGTDNCMNDKDDNSCKDNWCDSVQGIHLLMLILSWYHICMPV